MNDYGAIERRQWLRGVARAARLWSGLLIGAAALNAQFFLLNPLTPSGSERSGVGVYGVSVYTGYTTEDANWAQVAQALTGINTTSLPTHSISSGVTASMGLRLGEQEGGSQFAVVYSPSYSYSSYGEGYSSLAHSLGLTWDHRLASRWHFFMGASAVTGNFDQLLFSPTSGQSLASLLSSAGTITLGQAPPNQAATNAPVTALVTPQQRLIYGNRMLSATAQAGLSFAPSRRLSVGFSVSGSRMQHLRQDNATAVQNAYVLPQTTDMAGSVSLGYSLSPRTTLSGSVSYGRAISIYGRLQSVTAQVGVGRRLTRNWYAEVLGGGAVTIAPVNQPSFSNSRGGQATGSAGLGYHFASQSFFGSVSRTVSDLYGLGATATMSSSIGWGWRRRGSSWSLQAGAAQDRLLGKQIAASGFGNDGFRTNVGLCRALPGHAVAVLQYAYVTFTGALPMAGQTTLQSMRFAQHAVQLNVGWGGPSETNQTDLP
jgi:hypothetical protein